MNLEHQRTLTASMQCMFEQLSEELVKLFYKVTVPIYNTVKIIDIFVLDQYLNIGSHLCGFGASL